MCICVYVYVYACVCINSHAYLYMCTHVYMYAYKHVLMHEIHVRIYELNMTQRDVDRNVGEILVDELVPNVI